MIVVVCGEFRVGVAAFDWWLCKKSWLVGFEEAVLGYGMKV